ncbi:Dual specificity phosphatase [Klebsormidium nitens]|uniref:protein-tyrosine-phosphatase n=1 Tax=Klebsormidium nitens TaxID=105231 RepID=A0A1Y1HZA7_KLENI|nr:Dual specificity phosphatase [Klebsormidium nitens]|eukprot:GAQ83072.1 Dual specificity phosphatase [Klebsormidium nitens]
MDEAKLGRSPPYAMKLVRPGLYIGNAADAADEETLRKVSITHILCLAPTLSRASSALAALFGPPRSGQSSPAAPPFRRLELSVKDDEDQNLLDHLPECIDFIEEGRAKGGVLVHCVAGISRSGSVVTAYLMYKEGLSAKDALASLRQASPSACPNDGFLEQLSIFESMGNRIDERNTAYKMFRLTSLGRAWRGGEPVSPKFADDPNIGSRRSSANNLLEEGEDQLGGLPGDKKVVCYRCRKCRRAVAGVENVLPHDKGGGQSAFDWKKRSKSLDSGAIDDECSSYFVEPMQWMNSVHEGELEGKILCSKCQSRLGSFNWSGTQCSCGAWITPAFQLNKSKVDESWT